MKIHHTNRFLLATISLVLSSPAAMAADIYWDTNDTAADSGAATGTWGTDLFWSPDVAGLLATANTLTTGVDDLFFSAGTTGTGGIVTVDGSRTARKLTFEEGAITLSGGTLITLAGGGGLTVDVGAGDAIVSTALAANGNNIFNIGTGRILTLDTGDFTRGTQATLNVQGAGTVASSMPGLSALTNDILGPWASIGTGAATQYATISAGTITGLTGTAAATATDVTDTGGTSNYDVADIGTLGAGASVNTLRYTGAAGTIAGGLTTKGIMNAGSGLLTFSGAMSAGANNTEIVLNAANHNITLSGILTGAITKTGSGTVTMGNVAHNIAGTHYVNEGILITNSSVADGLKGNVTINNGGTLRWASGGDWDNGSQYTINAGGTLDLQSFDDLISTVNGAGTITGTSGRLQLQGGTSVFTGLISGATLRLNLQSDAAATVTLSNLNTYGGTTTIQSGTLNINSIGNVTGGASAIGNPTTAANGRIAMGATTNTGTLVYTGGAAETNRVINLAGTTGGATLTQSGTGLLKFTSAFIAGGAGSKTLTLSGSTAGTGEIVGAIVNNSGANLTSVTKTGSGTWALSGNNTYTGATLISGGTLQIGNGIGDTGLIAAASAITNDATLRINRGGALDMANAISGTGTLVKDFATGDLILNGNNSYGGGTSVNAGRLFINTANSLPTTGNVTVANGATLAFNAAGTYNSPITVASGATISARPATTLNSVTLPGPGTVIFHDDDANTNLLTITNNQTLTGDLTVQIGGSRMQPTTTALGGVTMAGNLTGDGGLVVASSGNLINNPTLFGTGTLTLSGANTYTGPTTVTTGTLAVTGSLGATAVTVGSPAILSGNGNIGGNVMIGSGATHALAVAATPAAQVTRAITGTLTLTAGNLLDLTAAAPPADGEYVLATADTISGTPTTIDYNGIPGTVTVDTVSNPDRLLLTVAPANNYASWAALQVPPVVDGPNGDDDQDGVKNLVEYALADGQERGTLTATSLSFAKRGAPYGGDLTYAIESSEDLGIADVWSTVTPTVNDSSTISYTFTPGTPAKEFFRLKVVQAP